jgi:RNA polymerase sigma-70 factor (ECF subfamily)
VRPLGGDVQGVDDQAETSSVDPDVSALRPRPNDDLQTLALSAAAGDEKAKAELIAAVKASGLARKAAQWLANPADVDDVEQRTLMKIDRDITSFRGIGTFRGWITTLARNEARTTTRQQKRRSNPTPSEYPLAAARPGRRMSSVIAERQLIREATAELAPKNAQQELVFRLRDAGLSHMEIAEMLGIPHATSRSSYRRACRKLAQVLLEIDPDLNPSLLDADEENGGDRG